MTFSEAVKVCQTPKAGRNRGRKSKIVFVLIQAKNLPELNANCKKQDFDLNSTPLHKAAICGHPFLWNKVPEIRWSSEMELPIAQVTPNEEMVSLFHSWD